MRMDWGRGSACSRAVGLAALPFAPVARRKMGRLLPSPLRRAARDLVVKKDGEVFTEARAVSLGWECFFRNLFDTGELSVVTVGQRNADWQVRTGKRWRSAKAVDVALTEAQNRFLLDQVRADHDLLWSWIFWVTAVDLQKHGRRSGFHDLRGCFRNGVPLAGVCGLERKIHFGKRGYEEKLEGDKKDAVASFLRLARLPNPPAAQLLMVSQVTSTRHPVTLRTDLLIYVDGVGWGTLRHQAGSPTTLEGVWSRCSAHTLRGEEVRALPEIYSHLRLDTNHCGRDVEKWTASAAGLGLSKKRDFPKKVVRAGSGAPQRFVVTKPTLQKVCPRLVVRARRKGKRT